MRNIIHIVENCDFKYGGPSKSIPFLIRAVELYGIKGELCSLRWYKKEFCELADKYKIKVNRHKCYFKKTLNFSFSLFFYLLSQRKSKAIFHVHNLWNSVPLFVYIISFLSDIKYVVSPRGALFPWSLHQGYYRKKLAWVLFQKKMLNRASFIHATDQTEKKELLKLGITAPIEVIPNCIDINFQNKIRAKNKKFNVLFVARLHKKKGVEILLNAWSRFSSLNPRAVLKIVGNGNINYKNSLLKLTKNLGINKSVRFIKPIYKINLLSSYYKNSDLFVLPSYTENFGMSILEALSFGCPVLVSKNTPWKVVKKYRCGWWVNLSIKEFALALVSASKKSRKDHLLMKKQSFKLASNFDISKIGIRMAIKYKKYCK